MRALAIFLLVSAAYAQPKPADVDAIFADFTRPNQPGCALGVIENGAWSYRKAYGLADLERNIPLTTASPVYLASVSKQFTAAVIVRLEEQGSLKLDDSIRKYVPELPEFTDKVTIRHLIHHTSGLRDYLSLFGMTGRLEGYYTSDDEFLALMRRQKALNFAPGSEHLYSNSGYVMLTIIVKRITGKSIREFAKQELLDPIGLNRIFFADDHREIVPGRALGYSVRDGKFFNDSVLLNTVGDGGMLGTVDDFLTWDRFLYSKTGQRMSERGRLADGKELTYAFGLAHGSLGVLKTVGHAGGFRGYRTHYERFPEKRGGIVILCNNGRANPSLLMRRVAALYFGTPVPRTQPPSQPPPPKYITVAPEKLAEYAGDYYSEELDATYRLQIADGKLIYQINSESDELPLVAVDRFPGGFHAERDSAGRVTAIVMNSGRAHGLRFERQGGDKLRGAWRLIRIETFDKEGKELTPWMGAGASGVLVYDSAGEVSLQVTAAKRDDANSYYAYFGSFTVNEAESTVTHRIRGSLRPAEVGTANTRKFQLTGNKLTLTAAPTATRPTTIRLTFERS